MPAPLDVPPLVRERATSNGVAGQRWLDDLPELVAALADKLGARARSLLSGRDRRIRCRRRPTGRDEPCVLKVAMPLDMDDGDSFARSVLVHQLAGGRGCAELLDHDMARRRCCSSGSVRTSTISDCPSPSSWRPSPRRCGSSGDRWQRTAACPPVRRRLRGWPAYITTSWQELGRPCGRDVIDRALAYCDERAAAFVPSAAVLVHGDAHGWNTLDAGAGTFKFVDPEGLLSERAHDLAVPMREYNRPLLAGDTRRLVRERAELLASWCEVDPEPVWQWGFIERVSTGLANVRDFAGDDGMAFLEVAKRCL